MNALFLRCDGLVSHSLERMNFDELGSPSSTTSPETRPARHQHGGVIIGCGAPSHLSIIEVTPSARLALESVMTVTDDIIIRPARPEDTPTLVELVFELADFEHARHEVELDVSTLADVLFGEAPRAYCDVAERNGEIVGSSIWFVTYSTWTGTHGIYLEDIYVRESARRSGVAKAFLELLARRAVEWGYRRVEWSVLDWNDAAIGLYESVGAHRLSEWTRYRLDGDALDKAALGESHAASPVAVGAYASTTRSTAHDTVSRPPTGRAAAMGEPPFRRTPFPKSPGDPSFDDRAAPVTNLRGAGVAVDARRTGRILVGLVMVALAVSAILLFVAGAHKNAQVTELHTSGVAVDMRVTGCVGLLGGSGSNVAGYSCRAKFSIAHHSYTEPIPGSGFYKPGTIVPAIVVPSDPALVDTAAALATEHTSADVYTVPIVLAVVFTVLGSFVMLRRRRNVQRV